MYRSGCMYLVSVLGKGGGGESRQTFIWPLNCASWKRGAAYARNFPGEGERERGEGERENQYMQAFFLASSAKLWRCL